MRHQKLGRKNETRAYRALIRHSLRRGLGTSFSDPHLDAREKVRRIGNLINFISIFAELEREQHLIANVIKVHSQLSESFSR
jgi:hypothetical protein